MKLFFVNVLFESHNTAFSYFFQLANGNFVFEQTFCVHKTRLHYICHCLWYLRAYMFLQIHTFGYILWWMTLCYKYFCAFKTSFPKYYNCHVCEFEFRWGTILLVLVKQASPTEGKKHAFVLLSTKPGENIKTSKPGGPGTFLLVQWHCIKNRKKLTKQIHLYLASKICRILKVVLHSKLHCDRSGWHFNFRHFNDLYT
jgi:hypothetical protein